MIRGLHSILTYFIATVWLVNGLICKILQLVPRHEQIVARILGKSHSQILTILIGISEVLMSAWILSGYRPKFNALVQISTVVIMNILEFALAPDLLLWGRLNAVFALLFIGTIFYNEFVLNKKLIPQTQ